MLPSTAVEGGKVSGPVPPILVVTADGRAAEKARRVGAFGHLRKPFDLDDLVREVQRGLTMAAC